MRISTHPLTRALFIAAVAFVVTDLLVDLLWGGPNSALDNAKRGDDWPGIAALGAGGTYGGKKFTKSLFDKWAGLPGASYLKYMYDIASGESDAEQQDAAIDSYFDLTGIKHAPKGSPGGDIQDAADKFKDFSQGRTDI